ncbi:hypothetical protein ACFPOU_02930 [Massilia jejuensis]|uniref:Secreted protein n=1 Tax=Massilia jejuensis TaxID=648894 RepID=A0ABW0PBS0_9BURK
MYPRLFPAALLTILPTILPTMLLAFPAQARMESASMEAIFSLHAAWTVDFLSRTAAPRVSCTDASPYRLASQVQASGGASWVLTF